MNKKELAEAIKAATDVVLDPAKFTAPQLEQLREAAQNGHDAFDAKLTELTNAKPAGDAESTNAKPTGDTEPSSSDDGDDEVEVDVVTVRVNDKIAAFGGEFTEPKTRVSIGAQPVTVERTPFVDEKLTSKELVEAHEDDLEA